MNFLNDIHLKGNNVVQKQNSYTSECIPTDDLVPKTRCSRNQHSMVFQTLIANTDVYKVSF